MSIKSSLIINLSEISNDDKGLVGEKAANLGEMLKHGFPFPNGFVITPNAYRQFLLKYDVPETLVKKIFRAYKRLESPLKDAKVEIFLSNPFVQKKEIAKGEAVLLEKIKSIWNSFLTSYDYLNVNPAIIVAKIIQSLQSGIMHTIDPINNDKAKIIIKEEKSGNHYEILRKNLKISSKNINKGKKQMLTDKKLIEVAKLGIKLQKYCYFPQEIYFAIEKNKIFITQTKPITHISLKFNPSTTLRARVQSSKLRNGNYGRKLLLKGNSIYPGIATGRLRIIQSVQDINKILRGEIIVIPYQDLIKRPILKAGAIVATDDRLHQASHLTLGPFFSGKPTIITTSQMVKTLRNGTVVTMNSKKGEVYMGSQWQ